MSKNRRTALRLVSDRDSEIDTLPAAGKIVRDARGNAVWDWALEPDDLAHTSTTALLKKLADTTRLTLEGEPAESSGSWSGDPYNRSRG